MRILGVGRRENLPEIVELIEREYTRTHAAPARLTTRAEGIEVVCERDRIEDPFHSWRIRFTNVPAMQDVVGELQAAFPNEVTLHADEETCELQFRGADGLPAEITEFNRVTSGLTWPEVWRVEGDDLVREALSPERLFQAMRDLGASDVHLYPGAAPMFRVNEKTQHAEDFSSISQRQIEDFVRSIAPDAAWRAFENDRQCSFNFRQLGVAYARVSAFIKAGVPHCTIRYLAETIPSFEDLHVPRDIMQRLAGLHEGLVLVSGMTGSGKSTSVASLIDWINETRSLHILTIESPVEFVHLNKNSIVSQRDVGTDAPTAVAAVHGALRHDPDVIYIGEMRDSDTIRAAIDAAGTGHLVISTFHANSAAEVPNRIVSYFDPVERDLVRLQLRDCLRCVMFQRLVPAKPTGRVPALEFLFNDTVHVGECLISGHSQALRVAMQQSESASSILEQSLLSLVRDGLVDDDLAREYASNPTLFEQLQLGTYAVPSLESLIARR